MPLYDCMLLLKPHVSRELIMDLAARIGKHVHMRNGVVTNIKSFDKVYLGYGIKKLDGRFFKGQLVQMTMMATPNINKELHYLNKEDRLLRWLLVKHRNTQYGADMMNEDAGKFDFTNFSGRNLYDGDDDIDDDDSDDYEEYKEEGETEKNGNLIDI
ncbi:hypothetical protein IFM89_034875 [Coptis chinensis]|uniref:Ribosomal protein S6 n=1 Tax=Coptis chinensis TaxID=261450 RepID=A0A835M0C7_9MAGN|nr:hypothetical protein IFM89_034875 [Coptis chinensis]